MLGSCGEKAPLVSAGWSECGCRGMAEFLGHGSLGLPPLLGMAVLCIALGIAGVGITLVFTHFDKSQNAWRCCQNSVCGQRQTCYTC